MVPTPRLATGVLVLVAAAFLSPLAARAADFGDAPECMPAYDDGVIGRFPTCLAACPAGTQESACGNVSTPPGATGYVRHLPSLLGRSYWLGCFAAGVDDDPDGRVGTPGYPGCAPAHCVEGQTEGNSLSFDQDECRYDGADAGVGYVLFFANCGLLSQLYLDAYNAGAPATVYLNVLVDMNRDGDWNDGFTACGVCCREWAVKNIPLDLPSGCSSRSTVAFQATQADFYPYHYPTWARISLTDEAVDDDFPWRGSAGRPDGAYHGGETEDYRGAIIYGDPVAPRSWGELKTRYR